MADAQDLGFCAIRRTGSSPVFPILIIQKEQLLSKENELKIETQPRDDHQVTLIVEIESNQMEGARHRAARKISEKKHISGFRPGKAPYEVVLRNFGEGVITEEAVDLLLEEVYPKALEQAKLEPAAAGSLEKLENLDKEPKFTFIVPLTPSVDLGDYRSIRLPYDWKEPGEDKLQESLEELQRMYAKTETVDRAIQAGDFVMVDIKAARAKGSADEEPIIEKTGMPVFIRTTEKEDEYPFNGFSKELIGMNVNENRSFNHKYSKEEKDEKLRGESVKFEVKTTLIRGSTLPELNDEFAKQVGPFETYDALRDAVKANLSTQSKTEYDDDYFSKVMELIKGKAVIKYPPQVLDHELEHVMEDLKSRLENQGMDMAAYLKTREMDEEKFIAEEAKPIAIRRLERSLVMDEIARTEKIEVSRELLQSSFEQTMGEYQGHPDFQKSLKGKSQPPKQFMNAVAMESANRAYIQQTLDRIKDIAEGKAPEITLENKSASPSKKSSKSVKTEGKKKVVTSKGKVNKTAKSPEPDGDQSKEKPTQE